MEIYIVRIYTREPDDPSKVAGTVEEPGNAQKQSFADIDELTRILRTGIITRVRSSH